MSLNIKTLIEDESADRNYFAMVPAMLWPDIKLCSRDSDADVDAAVVHAKELGISLGVHDRWLYATLKKICGEKGGQCFMSSRGLAKFAGMSTGQLSKSKGKLAKAGLITIIAKKRSVKGRAIDHIKVIDIWEQNIQLIKARRSVHEVNAPEEKCSPSEQKCSPSETEEEPIEEEPIEEENISSISDENLGSDLPIEEPRESTGYKPGPGKVISCVDPDTDEEVGEPDWRFPQTQIQHQAFNITGRKRFRTRTEYNKMRKIEYKLENGELPHEFWEAQKGCARKYSWNFPVLLKSTLNPDRFREWQAHQ